MKIVHLIYGLEMGGAEKVVVSYLEQLSQESHLSTTLIVISSIKNNILTNYCLKKNLNVIFLDGDKREGLLASRIIRRLVVQIRILINLWKIKPTIIHTHLDILHLTLGPSILFFRSKKIHTIHGDIISGTLPHHRLHEFLAFRIFGVQPISLTREMKKHVLKYYRIKICHQLYNWVEKSIVEYDEEKRHLLRNRLGIKEDTLLLGFVGRLVDVKNPFLAIKIFQKIASVKSNVHLLLVGQGELESQLRSSVDSPLMSRVHFYGVSADMSEIYSSIDIAVFTSKSEGLGVSFLEAQFSGIPCIITPAYPKEAIVSSDNILFHPTMLDALDTSLTEFIQHPRRDNIDLFLSSEFTKERVMCKLISFYEGESNDDENA